MSQVDRLKGKFRSFMLASFQNCLSVRALRALRLKRGGQCQFISLDLEGETVESLIIIKRFGRLEEKLALEIASQVAAVHEQKLVHRDIKH